MEPKAIAERAAKLGFPAAGLTDEALQTLIMMVLSEGTDVRGELTGEAEA